ncbi:glucose 1-dehydrogenase-like [Aphomia sociella]
MRFTGKVVLVTGASSGIGAATAIKFASEGAKVVIVGRNEKKLQDVSNQCKERGSEPLIVVANLTKDNDVQKVVSTTISSFGKLDVLVNNAGIAMSASILAEHAIDVFDSIIATNLRVAVYLTNLAAKHLIESKGNIVNVSSIASLNVLSKQSFAYSTSKAGLDHFTRCVALELASKGVRCNVINPGPVKTDILENSGMSDQHEQIVWDMFKKNTALNRISESEEVADLVLFLASDNAKGITGSSFVTDNGVLLKNVKM